MVDESGVILFHPSLVPLILASDKTLTYRLSDDGLDVLDVGEEVDGQDSSTGQRFARLRITSKEYTTFAELPIDRTGNVTHASKQAQRATFRGYYGREILDEEPVLILEFEVLRRLS
jgi:hypothetical protein